jgi:hypothetical protein
LDNLKNGVLNIPTLAFFSSLVVFSCLICDIVAGQDIPESTAGTQSELPKVEDIYHTPMAGEPYRIQAFGRVIDIPARDRDSYTALSLGAEVYHPRLGSQDFQPIAALYVRHRWDDIRFRGIFSIFVNELDISQTYGSMQLLGHLDNDTVPFASYEIVNGQEVDSTAIIGGNVNGRLGAGLRLPVYPFQADNDFRMQVFYQLGYLYSQRTSDTGQNVVLPPDTIVQGLLYRIRYDGLLRNIMELPHRGVAAGFDAQLMRRNNWSDANYGGAVYTRDDTRDYMTVSGYLIGAFGIPGLSEKNRFITSVYGGTNAYNELDRFSAFRIGGGPFPNETDDLFRPVYPGALFNQFPVTAYMITNIEYRRELFFFLYFHLRGTYAWVNQDIFTDQIKKNNANTGEACTVAVTSGFPWRSEIYLEYSYDTRILRNGTPGNAFMALWSKEF